MLYPKSPTKTPTERVLQHDQLSRAKDSNKASKKKDGTSGTASPLSGSTLTGGDSRSPTNSNAATPSSSSTNVSDIRSRTQGAEPPAAHHAPPVHHVPQGSNASVGGHHYMPQPPGQPHAGPGTPARQGHHMAPSVVISPSAPDVPRPGATETMPNDLAPPKAGQKSLLFDRLQSTPKDVPEGIRTPKRQHSSRFDISDQRARDLE